MDPISNTDRIVMLLRKRLEERSRAKAKAAGANRGVTKQEAPSPGSVGAAQALAGLEEVDERLLHRSLVQNALAEHFGDELINDAQFQQAIERVTDTMRADENTRQLFERALRDLKRR